MNCDTKNMKLKDFENKESEDKVIFLPPPQNYITDHNKKVKEIQRTIIGEMVGYATKTDPIAILKELEEEGDIPWEEIQKTETALSEAIGHNINNLERERNQNAKEVVKKVRKTYSQPWHFYNKAQCNEKIIVLQLLRELLEAYFINKEKNNKGRPKIPIIERIYCMFLYVYFGWSSRRTVSDFELSRRAGIIERTYHYNSILNFFNDNGMTNFLTDLIRITSLSLRMFEKDFSIDSSGFSTSTFERWFDVKNNKFKDIRHWKKAHIITGNATNIITAVKITNGTYPDSPELTPLAEQTAVFFKMEEFSADKAYLSRENLDVITKLGAVPYIPFKSNSTVKSKGFPIWNAMFHAFHNNQEEYMKHYHKRSNVETNFHMIKKKLGKHLRTKNDVSQINEILMKILAHNLIVLVHEMFELGIEVDLSFCAEEYLAQINKA